jgi:hypothetical protein
VNADAHVPLSSAIFFKKILAVAGGRAGLPKKTMAKLANHALCCLLMAATALAIVPYRIDDMCTFPVISVTGTSYEIGQAVGTISVHVDLKMATGI